MDWIKNRLQQLKDKHNVVLVTNDHVEVMKGMADNTITVSAVDRSVVKINDREDADREKAILALAMGERFKFESSSDDLYFFWTVEVLHSDGLKQIGYFALFTFSLCT